MSRDVLQVEAVRDALLDQSDQSEDDIADAELGSVGNTAGFPDLALLAIRTTNMAQAWMDGMIASGENVVESELEGVPVIVLTEGEDEFGVDVVTVVAKPRDDLIVSCVSLGIGDPLGDESDEPQTGATGSSRALECATQMLETAR